MIVQITGKRVDLENHTLVEVGNYTAIIDKEDADRICCYKWYPRKSRSHFYAVRKKRSNGKEFLIFMHRQITHCPNDKVVHHKNRATLDNRKVNLQLMSPDEHHILHKFN